MVQRSRSCSWPRAAAPTSRCVRRARTLLRRPRRDPRRRRASARLRHPLSARRRAQPTPSPTPTPPTDEVTGGTAAAQLATLRVAGRAPMTGYDRARFGQAWLDADRNGCDTRNDVLRRDLREVVLDARTNGCVVLSGVLEDPYTGARVDFERGERRLGGRGPRRRAGQRLGERRGAARRTHPGRARERPPQPAGRRRRRQPQQGRRERGVVAAAGEGVQVRLRRPPGRGEGEVRPHDHAVRARAGRAAARRACPGQPATPDPDAAPTQVDQRVSDPGEATAAPGGTFFENCDAARAAGAAPVRRGDPGYGPHLDRDGDGSACE